MGCTPDHVLAIQITNQRRFSPSKMYKLNFLSFEKYKVFVK